MVNPFPGVSTRVLWYFTAGGGIATAAFGLYVKRRLTLEAAKESYYQDAIKALRMHPGAEFLLGKPIVDKGRIRERLRTGAGGYWGSQF